MDSSYRDNMSVSTQIIALWPAFTKEDSIVFHFAKQNRSYGVVDDFRNIIPVLKEKTKGMK